MTDQPRPDVLPLSSDTETLYRHVLRSRPARLGGHAESLGWPPARAEAAIDVLESLRLARRGADGVVRAEDPRTSVTRLLDDAEADLDRRRRELAGLRGSLETFVGDYRRGVRRTRPQVPPWERLTPGEVVPVVEHLMRTTDGPLLQVAGAERSGPGRADEIRRRRAEAAASGRVLRTIYPASVQEASATRDVVQERAAAGELQRFLPAAGAPVEFLVFGRTAVLLDEGDGPESDHLLLRPAALVEAFVTLFEGLWRRARPLGPEDAAQDARLLELLSLGYKDEAVARQLGLGLRTVRRRIAALMDEHGVHTRFQLGLSVAARRGPADDGRR
ncbi:hypothetical protein [Ornithinimicrobium kibberense]|uniref:HTH luxR-type domain-containing protein n=1 Tax=Ornithinimicrobium kibberense TaxID=282060 RepID=A0ABV5V1C2_9MICO|nr:hypothetical protein [Ornithinimicrobium kibberense]